MLLSNQRKGAIYTILSGACYGSLGYFGVLLMDAGLSVYNLLFWRFLIASVAMCVMSVGNLKGLLSKPLVLMNVLLQGAVLYGGSSIIYFLGCKYIATGLAMVIFFTYPAMVMLINALVHKHPLYKRDIVALIIIGIGLIFTSDSYCLSLDIIGIALVCLSALFYSVFMIVSKGVKMDAGASTFYLSVGCTFTCLIAAAADNTLIIPTDQYVMLVLGGMAVICTLLPMFLLLHGLKHLSATKASLLSVLEPLFAVFFGVALLGEHISSWQALGMLFMLTGAIVTLTHEEEVPGGV